MARSCGSGVAAAASATIPLFLDPLLGKTGAELTTREKNRVSHRAKALGVLLKRLRAEQR